MPKSRRRKRARTRVVMSADVRDELEGQRQAFRMKFGRDPGPGDPVFFDPDEDEPTQISSVKFDADVLEAMRKAEMPPQFVYAFKKTGLMGFGDLSAWPADRREEWHLAVEEYFALTAASAGQSAPDPRAWNTEIPELQACPITREDHDQVMECLRAFAPIQARGMTVAARMELAAALLAGTCSAAYHSAAAQGASEEGPARFATFEDLVLRRARELYAQGRA